MRLIDADELLTAFPIDDEPMVTKSSVRMTIRHMPTVKDAEVRTIERKAGRWIERWHDNKHVVGDMACSVCGAQMLLTFPRFCPYCGAYMRGEQDG